MAEVHQFVDVDITEATVFKNEFFEFSIVIAKKRNAKKNEDAAAVILGNNRLLLAVADGMGGHPKGDLAAALAVEEFVKLEDLMQKKNFLTLEIMETFIEANKSVLQSKTDAGTTLFILEILENQAVFFLVGDSKMTLFDKDGKVKVEARGHSYYDLVTEADVNDQVKDSDEYLQNTLSSCIGSDFYRLESCSPFKVNKSDLLIAGSDGLFDTVNVEKAFSKGLKSPREACQSLLEKALNEMYDENKDNKKDDITIIALRRL